MPARLFAKVSGSSQLWNRVKWNFQSSRFIKNAMSSSSIRMSRYPHPPISLYPQVEKIYNVNNRHYWVVTLGQAMYVLYRCEMPSLNPEGAQRQWLRIIFIQNVTIPSCLHSKELPSDYLRIIYRLSNLFPQKEIWHHFTIKQKKDQGCDYLLYLIVGSSQAKAIRAQGDRSFNIF